MNGPGPVHVVHRVSRAVEVMVRNKLDIRCGSCVVFLQRVYRMDSVSGWTHFLAPVAAPCWKLRVIPVRRSKRKERNKNEGGGGEERGREQ